MAEEDVPIFLPTGTDDAELCQPVESDDAEKITLRIDGRRHPEPWQPIAVRLVKKDYDGRQLRYSDSPWYTRSALIFRQRAIQAMGELLLSHGELLPLQNSEADLHIYNPWILPGALDEERSEISRFEDGRVMEVKRFCFRNDVVAGVDMFKLDYRASETLVSERFVHRWRAMGLTGLDFHLLSGREAQWF